MRKSTILLGLMLILMSITVNADYPWLTCTPDEPSLVGSCIGITQWDLYYYDWCWRYDLYQDGVINLIDVVLYAQECNGGNENEKIRNIVNINCDI